MAGRVERFALLPLVGASLALADVSADGASHVWIHVVRLVGFADDTFHIDDGVGTGQCTPVALSIAVQGVWSWLTSVFLEAVFASFADLPSEDTQHRTSYTGRSS